MNGRAEPPRSLVDRSRLPADRILFYDQANESIIATIGCGVLFVMAFWSVYAFKAYDRLTEALASSDPDGRLTFVVVDTDGVPALFEKATFLGKQRGSGETAWVKDGRIVSATFVGHNFSGFERNTLGLLELCNG